MPLHMPKDASLTGILVMATAAALWLLVFSPPNSRALAEVSGIWNLRVESGQGTATPTVVIRQTGDTITGEYQGQMGAAKLEGTIQGNSIVFFVVLKFRENSFTIQYEGTVDGDAMQGKVSFGDEGSGTWTAVRRRP